MENKYKYEIVVPDPPSRSDEYYIINGQIITEEEFLSAQFRDDIIGYSSVTHVMYLPVEEILKRFGDTLTPEQIETLKKHQNGLST